MRRSIAIGLIFGALACTGAGIAGAQTRNAEPGDTSLAVSAPWAAGKDNTDPTFTPDGNTVVFAHGKGTARGLYVSRRSGGRWSEPELLPFSRQWMNFEPTFAPDGAYLVFVSNRPAHPGDKPLDGYFGGKWHAARGGNLWRVDFSAGQWGVPVRLPAIVNADISTYSPAVAADGDVYFTRPDSDTHNTRLYLSRRVDGRYQAPQPVTFSDGVIADYDPAIAPDGAFIVFSSDRPPTPQNHSGLFVAFRNGGGWSRPESLHLLGYEARLSPDAGTLYYSADADGRVHRFDLAGWRVQHGHRAMQ